MTFIASFHGCFRAHCCCCEAAAGLLLPPPLLLGRRCFLAAFPPRFILPSSSVSRNVPRGAPSGRYQQKKRIAALPLPPPLRSFPAEGGDDDEADDGAARPEEALGGAGAAVFPSRRCCSCCRDDDDEDDDDNDIERFFEESILPEVIF